MCSSPYQHKADGHPEWSPGLSQDQYYEAWLDTHRLAEQKGISYQVVHFSISTHVFCKVSL